MNETTAHMFHVTVAVSFVHESLKGNLGVWAALPRRQTKTTVSQFRYILKLYCNRVYVSTCIDGGGRGGVIEFGAGIKTVLFYFYGQYMVNM